MTSSSSAPSFFKRTQGAASFEQARIMKTRQEQMPRQKQESGLVLMITFGFRACHQGAFVPAARIGTGFL